MGKPLTTKAVLALKPRIKPYEIRDPGITGAYVVVSPSGAFSYVLRYRFAGAKKKLTIGRFDPATGLADVRARAHAALADLAKARRDPSAIDPASAKTQARREAREAARTAKREAEQGRHDEVGHVVALFAKRHLSGLRTGAAVARVLEREVAGRWKGKRLGEISRADIHDMLDTVGDRAPVQAARLKAYLSKLFKWARSRGMVEHNPVEEIDRPNVERTRDRVLDDAELRLVWKAAGSFGFPFGPITQMLILSGQRLGEVAGMRWSELDFDKKVWRLPAERVKNNRAHEIPLTAQMLAILDALPRIANRDLVFSTTGATPVSGFSRFKKNLDSAVARLNDGKPLAPWRLHDIRRTCASGMAALDVNLPVIEKILNHVSGSFGGIVGVYQRHSFADEKREALNRWNAHIERIVSGANEKKIIDFPKR
ncbi:tyrosine-type recombinase/integrase [Methylocystis sp. H4A]|uniref:tyrosine-type recombinase/integrase n=1 Tax=Methylocystis sp. H4A TaxID=2785788 RepID=UPI0018C25477|nr:site-specific integrase [Methylocystis sp. H4A]MBG0800775.1 tyrosine-type recombinase/integrase [Methylocystis sp. H4A]